MMYDVTERPAMIALVVGALFGFALIWASRWRSAVAVPGWSATSGGSRRRNAATDAGLSQI